MAARVNLVSANKFRGGDMKKILVAVLMILAVQTFASMVSACNCGKKRPPRKMIEAVQ